VERADGGHRVQERRAEEDELIVPASAPPLTRGPEWTALAEPMRYQFGGQLERPTAG
jgi:hypothetical protein